MQKSKYDNKNVQSWKQREKRPKILCHETWDKQSGSLNSSCHAFQLACCEVSALRLLSVVSRDLRQLTTQINADFIKKSLLLAAHLKKQNPDILGGTYMRMNHFALIWSISYWNLKGSIIKPLSFLGAVWKTQDGKHAEVLGCGATQQLPDGAVTTSPSATSRSSHPWKQLSLTGPQSCYNDISWTKKIYWPDTRPELWTQHLKASGTARMSDCHSPPSKLGTTSWLLPGSK